MVKEEYQPLMDQTAPLKSSTVPVDKHGLAWACFCALGIALLFPFNCYIAASDYFDSYYGSSYSFKLSLAYNYFQWVLLFVSAYVMPRFSVKKRITIFLLSGSAILFFIPFIHMIFVNKTAAMLISLFCTFASGCFASLLFGSVLGLVALFPLEYTGAVMSGNGVAGVIASILRIITKLSYSDSASSLKSSSFLYFFLGGGLLLACFGCFLLLLQLPITKHYLAQYEESRTRSNQVDINGNVSDKKKVSMLQLLKKVWREALVVFTVFFTTLSLFPGITGIILNTGNSMSQDWFQIIFTLTFMLGDVIGRTVPKWFIIFKPNTLWIPAVVRLSFFVLFPLCVKPLVFNSIAWYFIFMFLFSLSNGYCGTLAMMFGPTKADDHEKEVTGIIMSFSLNFGIWIATHFAFLLLYLITGSSGITL